MKNIIKYLRNRLKNYGFWASSLALIPIVLQMFCDKNVVEEYSVLANGILTFIVAAGIVNNPTTESKWFLDDEKDR